MKLRTTPEGLIATDRARWIRLQNGTGRLGRLREAEVQITNRLLRSVGVATVAFLTNVDRERPRPGAQLGLPPGRREFERVSGLVWAVRDIATGGL